MMWFFIALVNVVLVVVAIAAYVGAAFAVFGVVISFVGVKLADEVAAFAVVVAFCCCCGCCFPKVMPEFDREKKMARKDSRKLLRKNVAKDDMKVCKKLAKPCY